MNIVRVNFATGKLETKRLVNPKINRPVSDTPSSYSSSFLWLAVRDVLNWYAELFSKQNDLPIATAWRNFPPHISQKVIDRYFQSKKELDPNTIGKLFLW